MVDDAGPETPTHRGDQTSTGVEDLTRLRDVAVGQRDDQRRYLTDWQMFLDERKQILVFYLRGHACRPSASRR